MRKTHSTTAMLQDQKIGRPSNNLSGAKEGMELTNALAETDCYLNFFTQPYPRTENQLYCNSTWDGISCWPTSPGGSIATVSCFSELNGVRYDITRTWNVRTLHRDYSLDVLTQEFQRYNLDILGLQETRWTGKGNASRQCLEDGTWSAWSNYRSCKPMKLPDDDFLQVLWDVKEAATIYYVGYGFSLVALTLALFVFLYFKDLRCLRNTIHTNLMVTYLLIDITWILTATLQSSHNPTAAKAACFMVILLTYLLGTNFFWMFVEGLYLYILVVKTFSIDKVKFKMYLVIGWGLPAIVAAAWAGVKGVLGHAADDPLLQRGCPWQNRDYYDYIFITPVVLVLLINIFFLGRIMWVLITKLRASNTVESKQYRKAAKALLVLIPLLGVTYILVIATPSDPRAEVVFTYIQATLLSIQGFIVAVLYCFLNGEVQNSVRHHLERWKTQKAIGRGPRHSLGPSSQQGECVRLYSSGGRSIRGSCTSFTTSTTVVNTQCNRSPADPRNTSPNHLAPQDDMV